MRRTGAVGGGIALAALLLLGVPAEARILENLGLTVGGGMGGYSSGGALPGGVWSVRADAPAAWGLRIGFAYEGSANQLGGGDPAAPPLLVRHAGAMTFRLDAGEVVRPWVESGVGMSHFAVVRAAVPGSDLAAEFPLATGIELRAGLIAAGVRVGYNFIVDDELVPEGGSGMWTGGLTLGARF